MILVITIQLFLDERHHVTSALEIGPLRRQTFLLPGAGHALPHLQDGVCDNAEDEQAEDRTRAGPHAALLYRVSKSAKEDSADKGDQNQRCAHTPNGGPG